MGCDIHIVAEKKIGPDKWLGVRDFHSFNTARGKWCGPAAKDRNYERFAALAGVRGEGPPARGQPLNASPLSEWLAKQAGSDWHSPTWYPMNVAAKIFLETDPHERSDFDRNYPEYHYFGVEYELDGPAEDWRVLIWFDN